MDWQYQVINTFKSIYNLNHVYVLSIITLPKKCLHGKQNIIDIQPVFNHCKAVSYMCAYFSKAEAGKDVFNRVVLDFEKMKAIAKVYTTKMEWSIQEAVYLIMSEFWLWKTFPNVMFLTLSWRRPLSYRNQSIDLRSKSMDWFLYDIGLRHEMVKQ